MERYSRDASPYENAVWLTSRAATRGELQNIAVTLRLRGELDIFALRRALGELLRRHDTLRTRFQMDPASGLRAICEPVELDPLVLEEAPRTREGVSGGWVEAERRAVVEACRPFDLGVAPLLRVVCYRVSGVEFLLLVVVHHLVFDGWSEWVFWRELGELYSGFVGGRDVRLPELGVRYRDVLGRGVGGGELEAGVGWWRERLAGLPVLELPLDRPRPGVQSHAGGCCRVVVPGAVHARVCALAGVERASSFVVYLAAFRLLLERFSGQSDFGVGVPFANRVEPGVDGLIGMFVNPLVIRTELSEGLSFRGLVRRTRDDLFAAIEHGWVPFESVVEALKLERDLSRNPLFQAMFISRSARELPFFAHLTAERKPIHLDVSLFDLTMEVGESSCSLEYPTDLFDVGSVVGFGEHFVWLVGEVSGEPDRLAGSVPLVGEAEFGLLVGEWNRTGRGFVGGRSVQELFEEQVDRDPGAAALLAAGEVVSYGELDRRANRLAHYLVELGVGPEVVVGLLLPRSVEAFVGLLAVFKAGGAYLPLDPQYPLERVEFMLADAGARVLLEGVGRGVAARPGLVVVDLASQGAEIERRPSARPAPRARPDNLAYVTYTSGSTGTPHGVAMAQRSILGAGGYGSESVGSGGKLRSSGTSPSFDAACRSLLSGGRIVVAADETEAVLLGSGGPADTWILTARELSRVLASSPRSLEGVGTLYVCATPLVAPDAARALELADGLVNVYGVAECAGAVTQWVATDRLPGRVAPVGRPVGNVRVFVVDGWLRPVPVGAVGELCVSGVGLARGYVGLAGRTAARFVPNPFVGGGERLFRTGDRARFRRDGDVELLGRVDGLVKVRGHRVELGEVEAVLKGDPRLVDAVVVARGDGRVGSVLVAYVVAGVGVSVSVGEVRDRLRGLVPEFMVPAHVVVVGELPLTVNGKVDVGALPEPVVVSAAGAGGGESVTERLIAGVWSDILGVDNLTARDKFMELGGTSAQLVQTLTELERLFPAAGLTLLDLFEYATCGELAERVAATTDVAESELAV